MFKFSTAIWNGTGRTGDGKITCETNLIHDLPFSFESRFLNDRQGTNPEELLASAHASCFAMKLSFILDEAGYSDKSLKVIAKIEFVNGAIAASYLDVWAIVKGIPKATFDEKVQEAERCCPVSRALNIPIYCQAQLSE